MSRILDDFSSPVLARAIEDNIIEQYPFVLSRWPQFKMHHTEDLLWFMTNIRHPYLNYVLRAKFLPHEVDKQIERTLSVFRSRGIPMTWSIGPSSQPSELGRHLAAHGLRHTRDETGMAIDLVKFDEDIPLPPGLIIEDVVNEDMLRDWFCPVTVSFGYPDFVAEVVYDLYARVSFGHHRDWHLYVAYLNKKPVGASRLFLGAGVAGIYHVATVPEARDQGIGTALTVAALREARRMEYKIGVLRAADLASGVYRRIGFKEYCTFHFYVWPRDMDRE